MPYFNNQELATAHHVSVRTVRNWIEAARAGKLDLALHEVGQRYYIINTSRNLAVIQQLAEKNKKYRPRRAQKTVMPQSKFYELFTQQQLYDLVANLEINHEIPTQYNYFGEGAVNWDNYVQHLDEEENRNALKATRELFKNNEQYLDNLLKNFKKVNVIDIGVGNSMPTKGLLSHLVESGKMGRYIALDISPAMLEISERNIREWFGDKVKFESHSVNIDHERFGYLLADEYIKSQSQDTANVLLFLGGTIANFKKPNRILQVLHDSMGVKDFLVIQQKLDNPNTRRYFDFNPTPAVSTLPPIFRYIFDLLNIDESIYEVEMGFDPEKNERYLRVALKLALSIRFRFKEGERIISFDKNDTILLWRAQHSNLNQIVDRMTANEFHPIHISQTDDEQYVMSVSHIKQVSA